MSVHLVLTSWPVLLLGFFAGGLLDGVAVLALWRLRRSRQRDVPRRRSRLRRSLGGLFYTFLPLLLACLLWGGFFGIVAARYLAPEPEPNAQADAPVVDAAQLPAHACSADGATSTDAPRCRIARPLPVLPTPSAVNAPAQPVPATPVVPAAPVAAEAPTAAASLVAAQPDVSAQPPAQSQAAATEPLPAGAIVIAPVPWPAEGLTIRGVVPRSLPPRPPREHR